MNRIDQTFADLNKANRKGLFPFLVAGQGGLSTTIATVERFQQLGASGIEVGFWYTRTNGDDITTPDSFLLIASAGQTCAHVGSSQCMQTVGTVPVD